MLETGILVHYAEVATKGRNRSIFVKKLVKNLQRALGDELLSAEVFSGRLWLMPRGSFSAEALAKVADVPGVANFAPAWRCDLEMEAMRRSALLAVTGREYKSFRVRARRVFKELKLGSLEVDHGVGGWLKLQKPEVEVRMKGAELEVRIEMLPEGAFVYVDKRAGMGGLPTGSSGVVACLLSGGIDSPVAAWRMQRRGCRVVLIHFHSVPFLSRASIDKAKELAARLFSFQGGGRLHLVPFGELQREIVTHCPQKLRVVLYRRFMLRIAAAIAERDGARALVTGESLGQVASQTLANMAAIEDASPLIVLRPLLAYDKQEIIDQAQRLGTFEISIQPDEDCCTLFVPRAPETQSRVDEVRDAEKTLDIPALVADALARMEVIDGKAEAMVREAS
jgi:thiamine biosynthesis protein ThiI